MKSQNKKDFIELCALALLNKRDFYGYDLSVEISKRIDIADGTVYPILRKMKNEGLVNTYLTDGVGGPPRKYYNITSIGKKAYKKEQQAWLKLVKDINDLMEEE